MTPAQARRARKKARKKVVGQATCPRCRHEWKATFAKGQIYPCPSEDCDALLQFGSAPVHPSVPATRVKRAA